MKRRTPNPERLMHAQQWEFGKDRPMRSACTWCDSEFRGTAEEAVAWFKAHACRKAA